MEEARRELSPVSEVFDRQESSLDVKCRQVEVLQGFGLELNSWRDCNESNSAIQYPVLQLRRSSIDPPYIEIDAKTTIPPLEALSRTGVTPQTDRKKVISG